MVERRDGRNPPRAAVAGTSVTVSGVTGPQPVAAVLTRAGVTRRLRVTSPRPRAGGDPVMRFLVPRALRPGAYGVALCLRRTGACASVARRLVVLPARPRPRPLNVSLQPDTTIGVSELVRRATGGTLEARGADGTVYRLVIPPKALHDDMVIRVTPATGTTVLGRPSPAVILAPSRLRFLRRARLSITPPTRVQGPVAWSSETGGRDVHPFPQRVDGGTVHLSIGHFSGYGLLGGGGPVLRGLLNRPAAGAAAWAVGQVAAAQAAGTGLVEALSGWRSAVVDAALDADPPA